MGTTNADPDPTVDVFSRPATVRILCTLLDYEAAATARDVLEVTDISTQTFYDNVEVLECHGLVDRPKKSGNAWMYRAKFETDAIQAFQEFREALEKYPGR